MKFLRAVVLLILFAKWEISDAQITCDFTLPNSTVCINHLIQATANETSSYAVTYRCWTLSLVGGSVVNNVCGSPNQSYGYFPASAGLYELNLHSVNSNGDSCDISKFITVALNPVVSYSFSPTEICPGACVQATCNCTPGSGTITSVQIQWGCGNLDALTSCPTTPTTHCYTNCSPLNYTPTVTVTNNYGCFSTQSYPNLIHVIQQPSACFSADTTTANCTSSPLHVNFTACYSGSNITYQWFIDGTLIQSGVGQTTFSHTFPVSPNCYTIKLIVSHPTGCSDTLVKTNYICVRSTPQVCFTASDTAKCICFPLTLTNCTPGLNSLDWHITGPASFSSTGNTANFQICAAGIYTVKAIGTFSPGCVDSNIIQVIAKDTCPANFTISNGGYACKTPACFTLTADSCTGATYAWTFPNGSPGSATGRIATPCFSGFVPYSPILRVTSPSGCVTQRTLNNGIRVTHVSPAISVNRQAGCAPVCATFTGSVSPTFFDPVTSWCWRNLDLPPFDTTCVNPYTYCFSDSGCHRVRVIVTTQSGCVDSATSNQVCVGTPPVCTGITASPTTLCFDQSPVTFTASCSGTGVCFLCNWGDGTPSTYICTPTFTHQYQSVGTMNTCITPMFDSCSAAPICIPITVHPPIAKFTVNASGCNAGDTTCIINQSTGADGYNWSFCNGIVSTLENPCIVLPPCDTCAATLSAHNSTYGCTDVKSVTINTPCGSASVSPTNVAQCGLVDTFYNTSPSSIPNATDWLATRLPSTIFSHIYPPNSSNTYRLQYPSPGLYQIRMVNTSGSGCKDTVYANVKICQPIANFTYNSSCFPSPICFTSTSTDSYCTIDSCVWNFGDGSPDTFSLNPICHAFPAVGSYQVTLRVVTDVGCSNSITQTVVTSTPVNLNYHIDTLMCPTGNQHCVVNHSTGAALTYQWTIPNGTPSFTTDSAPCFNIPVQGDFPVSVVVSSAGACTLYDTTWIHVCSPHASGSMSDSVVNCPNPPHPITFINTSTCADSVFWSFGDFGNSDADTITHAYSYPGDYPISVKITTNDGCRDSASIGTIRVNGPHGMITLDPDTGICACKDSVHFSVATVACSALTMVYGCGAGTFINPTISPIGTDALPTNVNGSFSYCTLNDSCHLQIAYGNDSGCIVLVDRYLATDSPEVGFTFDSYGACLNNTVCFHDSTRYHIPSNLSYTIKRAWNFGDGNIDSTSNSTDPCHVYPGVGIFHPKLYIWSNLGCLDSLTSEVVIIPNAPGVGYIADSFVCANTSLCFRDTSKSDTVTALDFRIWTFDDGTVDTIRTDSICHTYTTGGYYTVQLCVYDSLGCPACFTSQIHVIDNPIANAGADTTVCYGLPLTLNGSGGTSALWSPPSLVSDSASYTPVTQLYSDTSFILYVVDQYQCKDTDTVRITVAKVNAGFNAGSAFCLNDSICVLDTSSNISGTLASWSWNWGDGTTSSGNRVCHKYFSAGNDTITEIVTDNHGCVDTAAQAITLNPNPVAAFAVNDSVLCSNEPLCVTDSSTSITPLQSWSWNYGAGSANGQTPPCYLYPSPYQHTYNVRLTVTDQNNCADSVYHLITLNAAPDANFTNNTSCQNVPTQLTGTSVAGDAAIDSCQWTLWVGAPSPVIGSHCDTAFLFPTGSHDVQLIVSDLNGCRDTIVKTIQTDATTTVGVNPGDTTICIGTSVGYLVTGTFNSVCWSPTTWLSDTTCSFSAASQTITPLGNVSYIVSASNGACEPSRDTVTIHVIQKIPIEVTATPNRIVLGLSSHITSQVPGQIDSIVWTPDSTLDCRDCANPVATPHQTTTYYVTIYYSENGVTCTNMDSVTITFLNSCDDLPPYLPNTFTPNGDGVNDVFMIRGIAGKKIKFFRIFDRWGKLVYESQNGELNDPRWGWDGTDKNGSKLNPAVFVYTYEIECINGETNSGKGNVSLVR